MQIGAYLNSMRDPAGLPAPAFIFDAFLVLTFALHILFVNLVIGSAILIVWGKIKKTDYSARLSSSLSKLLVNSVSWAIVLGVAPLLFIQVIYDPFWYTANTLSAFWALIFLAFIALGFSLIYVYYLSDGKRSVLWIILSLGLFLLAGIVKHSLAITQLYPESWPSFAVRDGLYISTGKYLHGFEIFRFLHFVIPSLAVVGVWLIFYAKYFRGKYENEYLDWVSGLGIRLALIFSVIQGIIGFFWLLTLPGDLNFIRHPVFIVALILSLIFILYLFLSYRSGNLRPTLMAILLGITVLAMSAARESLRIAYFSRVGYNLADYPVNLSLGSLILFLSTFIMGLIVLFYVATVAYRAGKGIREVGAHALGKISVYLLWLWIIFMVSIGLYNTIKG